MIAYSLVLQPGLVMVFGSWAAGSKIESTSGFSKACWEITTVGLMLVGIASLFFHGILRFA